MKKITVVIVNYNVKHYLEQCLISLREALEGLDGEVVVVDNCSKDGSVEYIREHFEEVRVIDNTHNLGFARANNLAIRQTESEYVLLLNPDTFVEANTLKEALSFMDAHPKAGGVGVQMLKYDGTKAMESRRGLPTPMVAFYKMCGLCERFPKSRRFGRYYMSYLPWDEPARIDVISGAFCLLRREALDKVGLLDEDFFMYGEDIDLSYRVLKGGYENWYLPLKILHYKGESTEKSSYKYVHVFYEAMLIFFRKHYAHASVFMSLPIKFAIYGKALCALIEMNVKRIRKSLGFAKYRQRETPLYVFMGTESSLTQCKKITEKHGLTAEYHIADEQSAPEGHLTLSLPEGQPVYVVYDTKAFSYASILDIFSRRPVEKRVLMGTFCPQTNKLITAEEVLR